MLLFRHEKRLHKLSIDGVAKSTSVNLLRSAPERDSNQFQIGVVAHNSGTRDLIL